MDAGHLDVAVMGSCTQIQVCLASGAELTTVDSIRPDQTIGMLKIAINGRLPENLQVRQLLWENTLLENDQPLGVLNLPHNATLTAVLCSPEEAPRSRNERRDPLRFKIDSSQFYMYHKECRRRHRRGGWTDQCCYGLFTFVDSGGGSEHELGDDSCFCACNDKDWGQCDSNGKHCPCWFCGVCCMTCCGHLGGLLCYLVAAACCCLHGRAHHHFRMPPLYWAEEEVYGEDYPACLCISRLQH